MIKIRTLENTAISEILSCFNLSFSDYLIPFHLELKQLESKLLADNINLNISPGAFKEGKLIGFVLHGVKEKKNIKIAYNGGTGVIPTERGQQLTPKMYDFILPKLIEKQFNTVILEVISNNIPAIKSYEKIGFQSIRQLNCYKGELQIKGINNEIDIKPIDNPNWELLSQIGEVLPTWQNAHEAIGKLAESMICLGAYSKGKLCGYAVLNTINNRIIQIAVESKMRTQRIGSTLLDYIQRNYSPKTSMINVDNTFDSINSFLVKSGLGLSLQQVEMSLRLESS